MLLRTPLAQRLGTSDGACAEAAQDAFCAIVRAKTLEAAQRIAAAHLEDREDGR